MKKELIFVGSSLKDICEMPEKVKKDFGGALDGVQHGRIPNDIKHLKGAAAGAIQLSEDHDGETYRAVYTLELDETVYVLHCFHKKAKSGIATPRKEIDLIAQRLKDTRALHAERTRDRKNEDRQRHRV